MLAYSAFQFMYYFCLFVCKKLIIAKFQCTPLIKVIPQHFFQIWISFWYLYKKIKKMPKGTNGAKSHGAVHLNRILDIVQIHLPSQIIQFRDPGGAYLWWATQDTHPLIFFILYFADHKKKSKKKDKKKHKKKNKKKGKKDQNKKSKWWQNINNLLLFIFMSELC